MNERIKELESIVGNVSSYAFDGGCVSGDRTSKKVTFIEFIHLGGWWKVYLQPNTGSERVCQVRNLPQAALLREVANDTSVVLDKLITTWYYLDYVLSSVTTDIGRVELLTSVFRMPYDDLISVIAMTMLDTSLRESIEADPLSYIHATSRDVTAPNRMLGVQISTVVREYSRSLL